MRRVGRFVQQSKQKRRKKKQEIKTVKHDSRVSVVSRRSLTCLAGVHGNKLFCLGQSSVELCNLVVRGNLTTLRHMYLIGNDVNVSAS